MTLAAAKSFGATSLAITDISPQNIALAKKMGATEAYCHPRTATPQVLHHTLFFCSLQGMDVLHVVLQHVHAVPVKLCMFMYCHLLP